jgi:hypothetical protein
MARVVNTSVLLDIHLDDPSFLFFLERNHLCHRLAPSGSAGVKPETVEQD